MKRWILGLLLVPILAAAGAAVALGALDVEEWPERIIG